MSDSRNKAAQMLNEIKTHSMSDPNAPNHRLLGRLSTALAVGVFTFLLLEYQHGLIPMLAFISIFLASLIMGIAIESAQRVIRYVTGQKQNTLKESYLDVMVTWLWFI